MASYGKVVNVPSYDSVSRKFKWRWDCLLVLVPNWAGIQSVVWLLCVSKIGALFLFNIHLQLIIRNDGTPILQINEIYLPSLICLIDAESIPYGNNALARLSPYFLISFTHGKRGESSYSFSFFHFTFGLVITEREIRLSYHCFFKVFGLNHYWTLAVVGLFLVKLVLVIASSWLLPQYTIWKGVWDDEDVSYFLNYSYLVNHLESLGICLDLLFWCSAENLGSRGNQVCYCLRHC